MATPDEVPIEPPDITKILAIRYGSRQHLIEDVKDGKYAIDFGWPFRFIS